MSNFANDSQTLSLTHHTFLVGPWKDAGEGAVLVTQLDDEDSVVLILKPDDVIPLLDAIRRARFGPPVLSEDQETPKR